MADDTHSTDRPQASPDGGRGWGIRSPKDTANHDWDAAPMPQPPPLPALVHAPAPTLQGVALPPPPPPPSITPRPAGLAHRTPAPAPDALPRQSRNPMVLIGAGIVAVALVAGGGFYLMSSKSPETVVPLSNPVPATVAVVHAGPAELSLVSLSGGGATRTVKLSGAPASILETPDRSKAYLLDTDHGDVLPVNLVTGQVGAPIAVGKLPVDEEMSADGSTLYITDNLGGTVIPIKTSTGTVEPARTLTQGVDFYVPSPTTSGALVGVATGAGQPGVVYFFNPATGSGSRVSVGANPAGSAFYSKDGKTVWVNEQGTNGQPGVIIPVDVATQKPGTPIRLGLEPTAYALTPNGATAVFANQAANTISIVDLAKRVVVATVAVGATPAAIALDASGTTAWVACALDHTLVPVDLRTDKAGAPLPVGNTPGDLTLPAAPGVAWVLFPSSNGRITFLSGTQGPLQRSIPVGNGPDALIGTGSETSWVANSLSNTVQRIDVAAQTAGRSIPVPRAPVQLKLTADGRSLLVLSYGDGKHAGMLTAINTRTAAPSTPVAVGPAPGPMVLSPSSGVAYVASYVARSIAVVDVAGWRLETTLALPCGPTSLAITQDGSQLFAACADSSAIVAITLPGNRLKALIAVPSVRHLVMPEQGALLLVVGDNGIANIDTNSDRIVTSVAETGNLVDVVETADGSTMLAIDNSGAALLMIDPLSLATTKSLALGTRPGEVALSPDGTHAYVLDTGEQKLFVVNVATWKITATINVAPDASAVAVPAPVVVPAA
jgi:YVTN family beta-propeller protein